MKDLELHLKPGNAKKKGSRLPNRKNFKMIMNEEREIIAKRFRGLTALATPNLMKRKTSEKASTDLNPLNNKSRDSKACQLCFKRAFYMCKKCRQSFYCSLEHKEMDMSDFHPMVCDAVNFICTVPPFSIFKVERASHRKNVMMKTKELLGIALGKAKEAILLNHPEHAQYRCSYMHRFGPMLYGSHDPHHLLPVLITAESLALQGKLPEAKTILNKADIILKNNPDCPNMLMTEYHRTQGTIAMLDRDFLTALFSFAEQVFWATEEHHPEHPKVAAGYYNLGTTFLRFNRKRTAFSFFKHAVDIWLLELKDVFQDYLANEEQANPLLTQGELDVNLSNEDAVLMDRALNFILAVLSQNTMDITKEQLLEVHYALAHLYYVKTRFKEGRFLVEKAYSIVIGGGEMGEDLPTGTVTGTVIITPPPSGRYSSNWTQDLSPAQAVQWMDRFKQFRKYCRRHSSA